MRIAPFEAEALLGPRHKERLGVIDATQVSEVQMPAVHHVKGVRFEIHDGQDVGVVKRAGADDDHGRHAGAHIEQRVQFDSGLSLAELRPRKQRQAQIDDRGVQGVQRLAQVHADVLSGVQATGLGNQHVGEIQIDAPVADFVGVCQRVARHTAADAHVVQAQAVSPQTALDVARTLAISQLRKRHAQELIPARERLDLVVAAIAIHASAELVNGHEVHKLRENRLAGIHRPLPRRFREKRARTTGGRSNRLRTKCAVSHVFSMSYDDSWN